VASECEAGCGLEKSGANTSRRRVFIDKQQKEPGSVLFSLNQCIEEYSRQDGEEF
jgi:hypothetical protein